MRKALRRNTNSNRLLRVERLETRQLLASHPIGSAVGIQASASPSPGLGNESAGLLANAEIQGTKWNDLDHDGVRDGGEQGLAGWTIYLDDNSNGRFDVGEPTTVTDVNGDYAFTGLAAGSYLVGEVNQAGWVQTFPAIDPDPNFIARYQDGVGGVQGLNGAEVIEVSPDGKYVYSAAILENSVSVFSRDEVTGELTFLEIQRNGQNGVDGLIAAHWLTMSEGGEYLYVSARGDDAVTLFSRDEVTGLLTYVESVFDGQGGVEGLNGASASDISPDGNYFYVTGRFDDAVSVFSRDLTTGQLTFLQVLNDGVGGVDGLDDARGLVISPDGKHVYVTALNDDSVAVFSRDSNTGLLTFVEVIKDGTGGANELNGAIDAAFDSNGDYLYVTSVTDDSVTVFSRNQTTGQLTFLQVLVDGVGGVDGLDGAIALEFNTLDELLYVNGFNDDALTVFSRDAATGLLTFENVAINGVDGVNGLDGSHGVDLSPDSRNIYVGSFGDDSVVAFGIAPQTQSVTLAEAEIVSGIDFGNIQVSTQNSAPVLDPVGDPPATGEGTLVTFTATATDPDVGDVLTFSLDAGSPAGATIDSNSGLFQWTPNESQGPGVYPITIRVTDDGVPALDDFETVSVTVDEVNVPPVLNPIGDPPAAGEGTLVTFTATATDPDLPAGTLTFSLDAGAPAGATIDSGSGLFLWTPDESQGPGVYPITIRVTDNGSPLLDDFETIMVTVDEVNQSPVLDPIGNPLPADVGQSIGFTATATDADLPANSLTFSLDPGAPAGALIDALTGEFEWTPSIVQGPGTYFVTVRVTDNGTGLLDDFEDLTFTVLKPGDVDGDGDVDFADFLDLQIGFGMTPGAIRSDGDLNGDGDVDFADFLILQVNFGTDTLDTVTLAGSATPSTSSPPLTNQPISRSRSPLATAVVDQLYSNDLWDDLLFDL